MKYPLLVYTRASVHADRMNVTGNGLKRVRGVVALLLAILLLWEAMLE